MTRCSTHLAMTAAALLAAPAAAQTTLALDPALAFADCAGRYSATMEHQWLTAPPLSAGTASRRAEMLGLLDAAADPDRQGALLHRRIEAKVAQADLLARGTFSRDAGQAERANRLAAAQLARCEALLLS